MREDLIGTTRSAGAKALAVLVALVVAIGLGVLGALWTGPESEVAGAASILAFAAGLFSGMIAWFWVGLAGMIARLLTGGRWPPIPVVKGERVVPGSWVFMVTCSIPAALAGIVAGLVPGGPSVLTAFPVYALAGVGYGKALRRWALAGYLPFMEPE